MTVLKYGVSFIVGIYVGTYFDCKPHIKQIEEFIRANIPNKK